MSETTQYPYSVKFSLGTILLMLILLLLLYSNVAGANTTATWVIFGVFSAIMLLLATVVIITRLVPALQGRIALELDDEGINDFIRGISIEWKDIQEISLARGRSAATLQIGLKWESDYGSQVAIPLRWVKGRDSAIYDTVMAYFERNKTAD